MKQELEQQLLTAYPKIFSQPFGGFCVGDGWYHILETLCRRIQAVIDNREQHILWLQKEGREINIEPIPQVVVAQIKEKFGGLRFYYDGGNEEISGMVEMAESWAIQSCETCGNRGKMRGRSWFYVACDEHAKEDK